MDTDTTSFKPLVKDISGKRKAGEQQDMVRLCTPPPLVHGFEKAWVQVWLTIVFLFFILKCYRSFTKIRSAIAGIRAFMSKMYAGHTWRRLIKVDGKYYFGWYLPSFPGERHNAYIRTLLNKIVPHPFQTDKLQTLQLAITNKCPMQCEHCFEWHNLNKEETFTVEELKKIIYAFQQEGCTQINFTGGEPLVRMKKLEELIRYASKKSECWIITSGHNLTPENAIRLKNAGAIGVSISLDHFDAESHNAFRGTDHAFISAVEAVRNANQVKLVTAFSICVTRSFVTAENLMRYAQLARDCGVSFVQLLEPKAVGHYEGKQVRLSKEQINLLDDFFIKINFDPEYKQFPVFIYHGYQERKAGCQSAGRWAMYIDSAGFIDACPFCHTRQYDAHDILTGKLKINEIQIGGCPLKANQYLVPIPEYN
jgi:MoaA/NifB/PqqE/SkfB family radical SAM enzyme